MKEGRKERKKARDVCLSWKMRRCVHLV